MLGQSNKLETNAVWEWLRMSIRSRFITIKGHSRSLKAQTHWVITTELLNISLKIWLTPLTFHVPGSRAKMWASLLDGLPITFPNTNPTSAQVRQRWQGGPLKVEVEILSDLRLFWQIPVDLFFFFRQLIFSDWFTPRKKCPHPLSKSSKITLFFHKL